MILENETRGSSMIATIALLRRRCHHHKKKNHGATDGSTCPRSFFVSVMTVKTQETVLVVLLVPYLELLQRMSLLQPTIGTWLGGERTMVCSWKNDEEDSLDHQAYCCWPLGATERVIA
jgi:hypothetical protein